MKPLYLPEMAEKAAFLGRNSNEFQFYVCFLGALLALDVFVYA